MFHIISKDGIKSELDGVKTIKKVEKPRNKKNIYSFIGQVNFLRRFIPSFADILRNVANMLRKGSDIKWTLKEKKSFNDSRNHGHRHMF